MEKHTAADYIKTLKLLGFDISHYKENRKGYYLRQRILEEYEIQSFMDYIIACQFITREKTKILLSKMEKLGSKYMNERLMQQTYIDNMAKTIKKQIFYNIHKTNRAIVEDKKIILGFVQNQGVNPKCYN
jgi:hypothetical protein